LRFFQKQRNFSGRVKVRAAIRRQGSTRRFNTTVNLSPEAIHQAISAARFQAAAGPWVRQGLQRKSFFTPWGKKDCSGKPGFFRPQGFATQIPGAEKKAPKILALHSSLFTPSLS
jgi:hypothetical protein